MKRTLGFLLIAIGLSSSHAAGQGDAEVLSRIVEEGTQNSQVWDYLTYLSEDIGPRLTGSSSLAESHAWTRDQFVALGLKNVHLQKWGEIPVRFDRGPSHARMVEPAEQEFEFTASSWSAGTDGPVRAPVVKAPATLEEAEAMAERLKGAWVLDKQPERRRWRRGEGERNREAMEAAREQREMLNEFLNNAGIAGRILGTRSDIVITGGMRGWREMEFSDLPADVSVVVRRQDYDAMNSRLADGEAVVAEVDLQHHFAEGPFPVFNTIAEIPGTEWPEQVVIISGHLDTWDGPGTQGAQDNGTGCAVALEAARILMAVNAKPKRTIRFILWTGEEQGLLGSRAYVESLSEEERANISAVFVEDGGTNYEGGLACIESMAPMLAAATAAVTEAFPDMPVEINVRERMSRGGGSDHAPFNRVGIPGFFWAEHGIGGREGKNYRFIHHTQHDTLRYAVPEYLVQSATCSAITAYNLAMADTLLPREVQEVEEQIVQAPDESNWSTVEGPLTGTWNAQMTGENAPPDRGFTFTFEMSADGRVRGTIESRIGEGKLSKVVYDPEAKSLSFSFSSEMIGSLEFKATVEGDTMTGTFGVEDQFSAPFKAERIKAEDIAAAAAPVAAKDESSTEEGSDGGS